MRTLLTGGLGRAQRSFSTFTAGQKAVTLLAVAAILVGGVFFARWSGAPTYQPLFSNLASKDAAAIVEQLESAGTPYELADGGQTILVPKEQVYDVRLRMSGEGLPAGDGTGYALLDKQGLTKSEFQQQVDYRRALEGELTKTLSAIDGVETAVVHLAIPKKDVFADEEDPPTASVLLKTAPGKDLSQDQVQSVVHLVSASIEGMEPKGVTVADSTGKVLSVAGEDGVVGSAGDARASQTEAYQQRLAVSVEKMLARVVGVGRAEVRVTADLDFDKRATTRKTYVPTPGAPPLAVTEKSEEYQGAVPGAAGVLGPDNQNVPAATPAATPAAGANAAADRKSYTSRSSTRNNAVGEVVAQSNTAPGSVRGLSVAVLLDGKAAAAVNVKEVTDLVSAGVGAVPRRDTVKVSKMTFDTSAEERSREELAAAKAAESRAAMVSLARTVGLGALLLAGLLIGARSARKRAAGGAAVERAELEDLRRSVALQLNEVRALEAGATTGRAELESAGSAAADRRDRARADITDLVERQPDEVAQLLRGWLGDRRA